MLEIGVALFSVLLTLATLASLVKWDDWWVRVFDFPRLQISTLIIAGLVLSSLTYDFSEIWHYLGVVALAGSLTYQGFKIFPYTVFKREQVKRYSGSDDQESISILVSNVLTPNRQAQ